MPAPNIRRLKRRRRRERGWAVTIVRRAACGRPRLRISRNFHDATYGGAGLALAAAKVFRDAQLSRLPPPTRTKCSSVTNTTGVVGVALVRGRARSGQECLRYVATWFDRKGRRCRASFSLCRYGCEKAFRLAVAARAAGLKARFGSHARALALLPQGAGRAHR